MTKERNYIGYVYMDNETIFEVGRFAILWNIFEDVICDCDCSGAKILEVAQKITVVEPFIQLTTEFKKRAAGLKCSVEDYVTTKIYPIKRARRSNADIADMPKVIEFINYGGKDKLEGGLLAIRRIRNNMFHGLKGHSELDDQISLFKAMNAVLEEVIK